MCQALANPLIFPAVGNSRLYFWLLYHFIAISKPTGIQDCVLWVMGSFKSYFYKFLHRDFRWKELVDWTVGVE